MRLEQGSVSRNALCPAPKRPSLPLVPGRPSESPQEGREAGSYQLGDQGKLFSLSLMVLVHLAGMGEAPPTWSGGPEPLTGLLGAGSAVVLGAGG